MKKVNSRIKNGWITVPGYKVIVHLPGGGIKSAKETIDPSSGDRILIIRRNK